MYTPFHAYLDEKDILSIACPYETSFIINHQAVEATLHLHNKNIFVYKVNYKINLEEQYEIIDDKQQNYFLNIRYYVKDEEFDQLYATNCDDLGPHYQKNQTTFKLWAPLAKQVTLCYHDHSELKEVKMQRTEKGIYVTHIHADLKNVLYHYKILNNQNEEIVQDPYAYAFNENSKESVVIDLEEFNHQEFISLPKMNKQMIIYELSVRDFSMDGSLGDEVKGKFNAFLKNDLFLNNHPIGMKYLKELGISHVQMMPIFDFATVNEEKIEEQYNWGYDPVCYNAIEGSYSTNPKDGTTRIKEAKAMIQSFHQNNIRVVLDVVFNHTYFFKDSIYQKIVPNYFYLMDKNGNLSNGSFCGNDIDTTRKMVHKYLLDMCLRYVSFYHIDGLRFDLMGILSKDLIMDIYNECRKINPDFVMYGEGWDMPSMLPPHLRTSLNHAKDLSKISFFNDRFRDILSGKMNHQTCYMEGYLTGNISLANEFIKAMKGSVEEGCYFNQPTSSINYIECHDNYTLYDKLKLIKPQLSELKRNEIQLMMLAAIIFAQGIPFIHCGMEFNRSKQLLDNSYNAGDEINMIRWKDVVSHHKNIQALKDFIEIRNQEKCFHFKSKHEIDNLIDGQIIDNSVTLLTILNEGRVILLAFNPTQKQVIIHMNGDYKLIANNYGYVKPFLDVSNQMLIQPYQFLLLKK